MRFQRRRLIQIKEGVPRTIIWLWGYLFGIKYFSYRFYPGTDGCSGIPWG